MAARSLQTTPILHRECMSLIGLQEVMYTTHDLLRKEGIMHGKITIERCISKLSLDKHALYDG
jgi:hypothetical protein